MNIALLSDTRLPTCAEYPGHGLGKMVLAVANGLAERGHKITLFAGEGSAFDNGDIVICKDELGMNTSVIIHDVVFDAVLDSSHGHKLQWKFESPEQSPVVNWSHDTEGNPGLRAVYPSKYRKEWHVQHNHAPESGRVIYNAVQIDEIPPRKVGDYFAYLSHFDKGKAPLMAVEACRLAGVTLKVAGNTNYGDPPPNVEYVGALSGMAKYEFLANAIALIYPGSIESGAITPLEAQLCGTPVICSAWGGAQENIQDGVTGLVAKDTLEMADAIKRIGSIEMAACQSWVAENRSYPAMIDAFENALIDASKGEVW